jgi:heterodisulfide reductase subunit B
MKYVYFPGCSSDSTAPDQHKSSLAVANALGITLEEPEGWTCCGSTSAHQTDRVLAASLAAANLSSVRSKNMGMVVSCASCYSRLKTANHEISNHPDIRQKVSRALGEDYDGSVKVKHFLEVLHEDVGLGKIKSALCKSLNDLKVASYYGCLLVRPSKIVNFDDPENPTSLDKMVTAMNGEAVDWPHKVECCGAGLSLSRSDVVTTLSGSILEMAAQSGAECIVVACPMCQANLDLMQKSIKKKTGGSYKLPIIYITQLLGICLGIEPKELGINKLVVSPKEIIDKVMNHD